MAEVYRCRSDDNEDLTKQVQDAILRRHSSSVCSQSGGWGAGRSWSPARTVMRMFSRAQAGRSERDTRPGTDRRR